MISWIVASHDRAVLEANLLAKLRLEGDDELIVVDNPVSIAAAYNQGSKQAGNDVRCFVHHDVQILDMDLLRHELIQNCRKDRGMVGVVGSRTPVIPWWKGDGCGNIADGLHGWFGWDNGGTRCAYLDGVLLATVQQFVWDEEYGGFHLYDYDACQEMLSSKLPNYCLTNGGNLIFHNGSSPASQDTFDEFDRAVRRFAIKWG
jgi:hypothetical protein